jgi:ribosomal protein S18 acetylase RimI-like enzyme
MDLGALRAPTDRVGMIVRDLRAADREDARDMLTDCRAFTEIEVQLALYMLDDGLNGDYTLPALEMEGRLAAFACIGHAQLTASTWYIYWFCVQRVLQGTGLGRRLQARIEEIVRAAGGDRVVLEASGRPDNERALRFYREAGFAEVGRIPDFYRSGDDCVVYCKILTGKGGSQ